MRTGGVFHHQPNAKAKLNWFCPVSLWQGGEGFPSRHHNPSWRLHPLPYVLGLTRVSVANMWRGRWGRKACLGLQDKRAHSRSDAQGTAQFCRLWMVYFRQQHETAGHQRSSYFMVLSPSTSPHPLQISPHLPLLWSTLGATPLSSLPPQPVVIYLVSLSRTTCEAVGQTLCLEQYF